MDIEKRKKILLAILLIVIVLFLMLLLVIYASNKNKKIVTPNNVVQKTQQQGINEENKIKTKTGYLVKINEKTIEFIEKEKRNSETLTDEEKQKSVESFNISLSDPVTPITEGDLDNRKRVSPSNLKIGQEIEVQYENTTKNLIFININKFIENK